MKSFQQFLKFAVVGAANTFLDWAIFFLLVNYLPFFGQTQNEVFAKIISFSVAVVNSFILNSFWTFRAELNEGVLKSQSKKSAFLLFFVKFISVSLIGLLFNSGGFFLLRNAGSVRIVALFLATFFSLVWNFVANKFWTYQKVAAKQLLFMAVVLILICSFALAFSSAKKDSATTDEGVHIGAGLTYLTKNDFRFDPEHPPLMKELQALPVLFLKPNWPKGADFLWQGSQNFYYDSWQQARDFGDELLYQSGNNADQILIYARAPMMFLYLLLLLLVFFWAKKLYGIYAGFLALILGAFCPNLIAHARLANTDIGLALFFTLSIFTMGNFLKKPNLKNILFFSLACALALLSKYSAIALFPIFIILALIRIWQNKKNGEGQDNRMIIGWGFFSLAMIWLIIFAGYSFSVFQIPATDNLVGSVWLANNAAAFQTPWFSGPWFSSLAHFLIPAYFFKGFLLVFTHVAHGNSSFLLGMQSITGWWYYFPVAFLVKTPLSALLLLILSIVFYKKYRAKDNFDELLLIVPVVIFFLIAMSSKANLGLRHILPIYPLLYIFISRLGRVFVEKRLWPKLTISGLALWFFIANLVIWPSYLAYFNEAVVGPKNGPKYLSDSNIDWGQDVRRLSEYLKENQIDQIYVDYFWGDIALDYYKINYQPLSPSDQNQKGVLVLSVSSLQTKDYQWLKNVEPTARIGYSIYVYDRR